MVFEMKIECLFVGCLQNILRWRYLDNLMKHKNQDIVQNICDGLGPALPVE